MNKISVTLDDGSLTEGYAVRSKGTLWVHLDGEVYTIEKARKRRGGARGANANPGDVMAPMPGKIIKIPAKVGESVVQGEVILVMEAMKMEYTLKAQANGKVLSVGCAVGDQVTLGQMLAKIEIQDAEKK